MGFLDNAFNFVKEAAFGDIKRVVDNAKDNLNNFIMRPIGLIANSYDFMFDTLKKNIGNVDYFYDGYGTPIGYLADPYLNLHYATPWFFRDIAKQASYNYIDYVRKTYGATISVQNINENHDLRIIGEESNVASIPTSVLIDMADRKENIDFSLDIVGESGFHYFSLNPNSTFNDTRLGQVSAFFGSETLTNSIAANTERIEKYENTRAISIFLYNYYGLSKYAVENDVLNRFGKGKSSNGINELLPDVYSPIDEHFNGISQDNNAYEEYIGILSNDLKEIYAETIKKRNSKNIEKYDYWDYTASNFVKKSLDEERKRYNIFTNDDTVFTYGGTVGIYDEPIKDTEKKNDKSSIRFNNFIGFGSGLNAESLLSKTNEAFKKNEYKTIVGKYRSKLTDNGVAPTDPTQTAVSKEYGMSHGRNLLKPDADGSTYSTEYDNPYCRVWTYYHQYQSLSDTIRPFKKDEKIVTQSDLYNNHGFNRFSADNTKKDGFSNGRERLGEFGVLNKTNGLVNISPSESDDVNKKVDIKNCMFSIENLAWKDTLTGISSYNIEPLSPEQKGPFGGRIMWFPPYDLKFNEDVNVSWAETNFIGRGESIYTYKNTKRTGTLSFKLLIDHPSIINYWNNAEKDAEDTVDDVNGAEQKLLRFFAGCELLTPGVSSTKKEEAGTKDEPIPTPTKETYTFFVFFPNNYSGCDDGSDYAMDYLINGYGPWKVQFNDSIRDYKKTSQIAVAKNLSHDDKIVGGYEIRPGISLNWPLKDESEMTEDFISVIQYGVTEKVVVVPMKQDGQNFKYFYRVDKNYLTSPLKKGGTNYLDVISKESPSLSINSSKGAKFVQEHFKLEDNYTFSFVDVYISLKKGDSQNVLSGLYEPGKLQLFTNKILDRKDKITEIICTGSASKPGNDNNTLAKNRARIVKKWLSDLKLCDGDKIKLELSDETGGDDNVNSVSSKLYRHVRVDIKISTEEANTVQNIEKEGYKNIEEGEANNEKKVIKGPESKLDKKTEFTDYNANPNFGKGVNAAISDISLKYLDNFNNGLKFNTRLNDVDGYKAYGNSMIDFVNNAYENAINDFDRTPNDNQTYMHSNEKQDTTNEEMESRGGYNTNSNDGEPIGNSRYDGEAKFFELLKINDPFLHHKISEKIKYFDPAFHSISPEGFNARLTFLQQCCRQGPTAGSSDSYTANNTANNLAFGRPPVCILRIGDFFYTKIIIEGVTIDYNSGNGLQWDLNQEGIGVMPMMADVTIRFNFIGGSSLSGPISRLQNALSFNSYANTEVYDDRAELAEFDKDGNITKFAPFNPSS